MVWWERAKIGEEPLEFLRCPVRLQFFQIKKCKQTDSSKIDRNCHIFGDSQVGNALKGYWTANGHCKRVSESRWEMAK
jgi:hypothetical protein